MGATVVSRTGLSHHSQRQLSQRRRSERMTRRRRPLQQRLQRPRLVVADVPATIACRAVGAANATVSTARAARSRRIC
jgi:hypothetical protein